jgi:hypothetical protein
MPVRQPDLTPSPEELKKTAMLDAIRMAAIDTSEQKRNYEFNEFKETNLVISLNSFPVEPPRLPEKALFGITGEIIKKIEPHTETHPASLLVQMLVGFGNLVGRGPYLVTERDRQHTNLFAVIVGDSSRGRKGTSWGHVRHILNQVEQSWGDDRIMSGLASGEGIIAELSDDAGGESNDKRLLLVEGEFAQVLKVCERPGNTISAILRNAWDSGNLRNMSKGAPLRASGCHISMIGHITRTELSRLLTDNDAANGFGNRILWTHSSRSKFLPDGGEIESEDFSREINFLGHAVRLARTRSEMKRSAEAKDYWHQIYEGLCEELPGKVGSVTSRAEAQVVRLALLFSLLDGGEEIGLNHLKAAEAVWQYCRDSAKWAFMEERFSKNAQKLFAGLKIATTTGLTRTQIITGVFANNIISTDLDIALKEIAEFVEAETKQGTAGAPTTIYKLKMP